MVILDQALVSGGNFALGVLLARWLGLSAFGTYSLLWMGVLFALSLHQAFVTQPLMTLFAQRPEGGEREGYFRSVLWMQIGISGGLGLLSVLAFFASQNIGLEVEWLGWLPLVGGVAALYLLQDTLRKWCFVQKKYLPPLLFDGLLFVPLLAALAALHFADRLNLTTTLWAMLAAYGLSCTVGLLSAVRALSPNSAKSKAVLITTLKEHYHFSIWLLGTSLLQWFSGNFFLIAAAGVLGTVAVGALRMAQNMVGLSHVLFLAMENIVPAEAARQYFSHGREKMSAYLRHITLMGSVPFVVLLGGLSLLAPWLIGLLYGAEYVPYSYLVWVFSMHYILVYIGYPLRFALRTLRFTPPIFVAYGLTAGLSLLLAFPMVRAWGMAGVMAGLMGAQAVSLVVYILFLMKMKIGMKTEDSAVAQG